jgi:hypothetical protein
MPHATPHSRVRAASAWCGHDGEGVVDGMSEVVLREHGGTGRNELDGMSSSGQMSSSGPFRVVMNEPRVCDMEEIQVFVESKQPAVLNSH